MSTLTGQYATSVMPSAGTSELLSVSDGHFIVKLPDTLKDHQDELERLLGKVFMGKTSETNLALARQMSINWCLSKCKQNGISVDKCLDYLA